MCLQALAELCGNAITILVFSFIGFIAIMYLIGIIISISIGAIVWFVLLLTNPLTWIFLIALLVGLVLLINI